MFNLDWLRERGATRGTPGRDQARRQPRPAILLLFGLAFLQSGCQSGPSGGCGGLFSSCGFFSRVQNRVFNRSTKSADCCGSGVVSDVPIEYGPSSSAVVPPGINAYPGTPGGASSSPTTTDTPEVLDTIPKAKIGPPTSSTNPSSKTSYQTRRSVPGSGIARSRSEGVARTMVSTSEPTSRSARAALAEVAPEAGPPSDQDPLDHLPPLDLPGEVTRSTAPTPATVPAKPEPVPKSGDTVKNKPEPRRENSASSTEADPPAPPTAMAEPSSSASVGPGLTRFLAVDLKLAGGGAPSSALGLQWLVEKGYRTLLDLREPAEVPTTFITEVTNKGLRYVALPMSLKTIDRDHVDRFHFEIAATEARPLFFFDSNGARAGALWYIRRILVDRVDPQIARREAEELGLVDKTAWLAATDYVNKFGSERARTSSTEAASPSVASLGLLPDATPARKPPHQVSVASSDSSESEAKVSATKPAAVAPTVASNDANEAPQIPSAPSIPGDPFAWRPFAAMVITGLSLPLAYWSRSVVPTILLKTRASLPGPGLRPRSLPDESDG